MSHNSLRPLRSYNSLRSVRFHNSLRPTKRFLNSLRPVRCHNFLRTVSGKMPQLPQTSGTLLVWDLSDLRELWGITDLSGLWTEICRVPSNWICCTHPRTIKEHHNAFIWGLRRTILKFASRKFGHSFFPITSAGGPKNDQFGVDFPHWLNMRYWISSIWCSSPNFGEGKF